MGHSFSRPQYRYSERRHPAEYFRTCDPSDCFCGGPAHFRQRNVAVHRTAGGREYYQDPSDLMDGMLGGFGYGMPDMGMDMGMGLGGGYSMPSAMGGMGLTPAMSGLPMIGYGNNTASFPGFGGAGVNWPQDWKDPREWTTRDYDRLGEIMDEYLSRQRGRGMPGSFNQQMSPYGQPTSPFSPLSPMDTMWDTSNRRPHRTRASHSDIDQLRAQMSTYAQEAKEHMQSVNDFLYGSEREQREERYKERQRKMIEDILKGMVGVGRNNDPTTMGPSSSHPPLSGQGYPGMHPMMGMPPNMGAGNPLAGHPLGGMQSMFPGGIDGMNPYAGMDSFAQRSGFPRQRRSMRGLGFGDGFDGQGGFGDDFGGRRGRRTRRGFDEGDDDMMDLGDGRRFPSGPNDPRRPRPDRGGSGAFFDDSARRGVEPSRPYNDTTHAKPAADSRWAAYEPGAQPRYEASPPPAPRASSYPDARPQASWSALGHENTYANGRTSAGGYTYVPPRLGGQGHGEARPHVSFQEPGNAGDRPDMHNERG